jgi:uncharacterized protein with GYD domain
MRVICIDNDNDWYYLTIGKIYDVINIFEDEDNNS